MLNLFQGWKTVQSYEKGPQTKMATNLDKKFMHSSLASNMQFLIRLSKQF